MKKLIGLMLLLAPLAVHADEGVKLQTAPVNLENKASLQRGAQIFANYCLSCHSANYMRYNRLQDLGLTTDQISQNLMFASDKVGARMTVAMNPADAAKWFGNAPPDLTDIARSQGANWLYTYLLSFYRDNSRPTGWNNALFKNVAMPFPLWQQQGEQKLVVDQVTGPNGKKVEVDHLVLAKPGTMTPTQYQAMVGDLVNYLVYLGEPIQETRKKDGIFVLLFLAVFFIPAYYLYKEYWKDIH
ncbi:MAG: cytochrome c1 [Betaproteobacteria bacterium]|nr:cytochrome c1 [Betaproteobacteria bacterium]